MLFKISVFSEDTYDCLNDDCVYWLSDMRTAREPTNTSCPVPVEIMCARFLDRKLGQVTMAKKDEDVTMVQNSYVTLRNVLRIVDTQTWDNCVIIYDLEYCKLVCKPIFKTSKFDSKSSSFLFLSNMY